MIHRTIAWAILMIGVAAPAWAQGSSPLLERIALHVTENTVVGRELMRLVGARDYRTLSETLAKGEARALETEFQAQLSRMEEMVLQYRRSKMGSAPGMAGAEEL